MAVSNGWVKLSRSMVNWGWYDDPNTKIVFLHLLLTANWKESEYHGYKIEAGQVVFGTLALAKRLNLTRQQVRTALSHLQETKEITIKSTNRFSVATIENWAKYQVCEEEVTNKTTNEQPTSNQQVTTSKEDKNIRNKEDIHTVLKMWNDTCEDYPRVIKADSGTARYKAIRARINKEGLDTIQEAFNKVQASPFLKGESDSGWQASFDWVMKENNFQKIMEGNYDRKTKRDNNNKDWDSVLFG